MNIILIIILLVIILILMWALFGGRAAPDGVSDEGLLEQERTLRRRAADKEIEKGYPEAGHYPRRRKDDKVEEAAEEPERPFQLPYLADEIIPETSRFRIYRRTLLNSEIYASKGDYSTAISLYEGVRARIQDVETRDKLVADIEYLKHYKKKKDEETKKKEEDAKKGIAGGVSINKSELKITFGGPMPNAINFDSLPENINIGVIDPNKNIDMETIVESVSQKLREEIAGEQHLAQELAGLKNRIDKLGSGGQGGYDDYGAREVPGGAHGIREEIRELGKAIRNMASGALPEADREPALAAAKLTGVPRHHAPGPAALKEPGPGTDELSDQKVKHTEEDDEFELLSEYGKEKQEDELSDEEIFARILREDKPKEKDSFEIIGEKKDAADEYVTTNEEFDLKRKEDESFYKRLLSTNRRKTKELPILKVSYDFTKLPDEVGLSREKNIIEYSFYKYKPMLEKANEYIKKRKVRDAINYYKVVMSQNIPPEFKSMIKKNLNDLTEYLEKYLSGD